MMNSGSQGSRPRKARSSSANNSANINNRYRSKEVARPPPNRPPLEASGVYADPKYAHVLTSVIGCTVQVLTTAQQLFEGVLESVSSDNETVLGMVNLVHMSDPKRIDPAEVKDKLIFKTGQIVTMVAKDVDPEFATKSGFQTDSAITGKTNGSAGPRELQPWVEDDDVPSDHSLSLDNSQNGWDAREMFEANERKFQVGSCYDETLSDYTTPLQLPSRDQEAHAARIADEIKRSGRNRDRTDQNGDEEGAFAAVQRPGQNSGAGAGGGSGGGSRPDRYVPPARRQTSRDPPPAPRMSAPAPRGTPPAGRPRSGPQPGPLLSRPGPPHGRPGPGGRGPHTRASPPAAHLQPSNGTHPARVNGDDHHHPRGDHRGDVRVADHRDRGDHRDGHRGDHRGDVRMSDHRDRGDHREDHRGDARGDHAREEHKPRTEPPPSTPERETTPAAPQPPSPSPSPGNKSPAAAVVESPPVRSSMTPDSASDGGRPRGDQRQPPRGTSPAAAGGGSGGKSGVIAGLKEFRTNFVLSEEPARREEPSRKTPTPTKVAEAAPAAASAEAVSVPAPARSPETKPAGSEPSAVATLTKSKLNPNAKSFTPSQPAIPVGYSPAPTPPARAMTPQAMMSGQFQSLLAPAGHPGPFGYVMGAQPFSIPQPQQQQQQQPPRMQKQQRGDYGQMGGMAARGEASPMQVAAVTGPPLMAPSPMAAAAAAAAQGTPHLSMQMPQAGLMPPGPQYPGQPQMIVRMMPTGMYSAQQQQQMQQQQPPQQHQHQHQHQHGSSYDGQQFAPPPQASLAAYGLVAPGAAGGQAGPPQPGTPGAGGPGQPLMYPMPVGGGGGGGANVPYPPNSMYVVSAAGHQMQAAQFAMLQAQPFGGPAAVMTSQANVAAGVSLQPQPYYIPQPPHHTQHYGPGGVHPMSLVPNPNPQ